VTVVHRQMRGDRNLNRRIRPPAGGNDVFIHLQSKLAKSTERRDCNKTH